VRQQPLPPAPAPAEESLVNRYSLSHLCDQTLLRDLATLVARDRMTTAALLAHLAECDARKLYPPAAYPSMHAYCVHELRLAEEAAFKRIHAARTARQFPALFAAVAEGRLHLTAVILLAPHLTRENADELLAAAAHQTKGEIQRLLAVRFPQPELPTRVLAIPPAPALPSEPLAVGPVAQHAPERVRHALTYFRLRTTSPSPGRSSVDGKCALMPGARAGVPSVNHAPGLHT
jgi:hypothetical protein